MLIPIQTAGEKPPLFFVHGLFGIMPLGPTFAAALGSDQPFYALHASAIDGRGPVIDNMQEMVFAYAGEIEAARPSGRIVIGGVHKGGLAAIEITRALQETGREVGP